ncbi:PREDICTED: uncharacterized protein LOC105365626 [Ceratosolen solmsi marchali]|uniref:Uncharacterized protein LOC105365626 n=1 Tax=Ceratosolen solmsi marchali TaxID=326594 RepID=A0AAJ6YQ36_9HYME|nr:PREDICTED: uncharacterized protein LOC105365626 [Ceratosolen solmsi marchali]
MPSPNFLDWCSVSISSIHRSVNKIVNTCSKTECEISPNIAAIQSLNGKTSAEKFKDLNLAVKTIAENTKGKGELLSTNDYKEISPAMTSLIQILVGLKLKINALIIQGLTSDDLNITRKALKATWFFNGMNDHVNPKYFVTNIMPFVSVNTRLCIIKKLSYALNGFEKKAEAFFNAFVELYGFEVCLSILKACSQSFIYDKILDHKIKFSVKEIRALFKKYPNLVIQYLQFGNTNNLENENNSYGFRVQIHEYDSFISQLLKNYPQIFIKLYSRTPEKVLKLENKLSTLFVKNLKQDLVQNPNVFLKLMPLKIVRKHLDETSFAIMISNLFPTNESDFNLKNILKYCKFDEEDNVVSLLKNTYKVLYNKSLFENKLCLESLEFLKMLPNEDKSNLIRNFLEKYNDNAEFMSLYKYYLPPDEVLSILKNKIKSTANAEERAELIGHMIISCSLYHSKKDLLEVLKFYNKNHKNEKNLVLVRFFQYLKQEFDLKSLNSEQWSILNDIIFYAYVKKELFNSYVSLVEHVLEACLYNIIMYEKDNKLLLDKIFNVIVEHKMEQFCTFNILRGTEFERECIEKCFSSIPLKYPENHSIWEIQHDRLSLALNFVKTIDNYNKRNYQVKKRGSSKKTSLCNDDIHENKLKIKNYSWIVKLSKEYFYMSDNQASVKRNTLIKIVKANAPDLYEEIMDKIVNIRSIESGEAIALLKKDYRKILDNWSEYLTEARKKLYLGNKAAKRFIVATKWYQDIPVKFIDKCMAELYEEGSFSVLALLLEGHVFEKIIIPYIPINNKIDLNANDAKINYEITKSIIKAMKYINPVVSFSTLALFCKDDYALLTEDTIFKVAQYVPAYKVLEFAQEFINCSTPMKKQSFRLIERVATKTELRNFLKDRLKLETNHSVRLLIAKMIFNLFTKLPNVHNWKLMEMCIDELSIDQQAIEMFSDFARIDPNYLPMYIDAYMNKIESEFNDNESNLDFSSRVKYILLLIDNLDLRIMNLLSEELCEKIVRKYFFDPDSMEISRAVQNFSIRLYLLQSGENLEYRLNVIIQILKNIMKNFNTPHPKKPRFYAANYTIQQFFNDMLLEISCNDNNKKLEIVERMLKVLNSNLSSWQEPTTYLSLNLYKEYLLANSPSDFGVRCAKRIYDIMGDFSRSESIINEITKCLEDFIDNKIYKEIKGPQLRICIIEGMLKEDNYYANLVGIKLLDCNEVNMYDERYDRILKTLKQKENIVIQCNLYQHMNKISAQYNEI